MEHLDDGVQVCQLAEVSVRQLARLHHRGASQQPQAIQLSQYLLLHLWVLRDEVPAGARIMSKLRACKWVKSACSSSRTQVTSRSRLPGLEDTPFSDSLNLRDDSLKPGHKSFGSHKLQRTPVTIVSRQQRVRE